MKRVSVIVPVYNAELFIGQCLTSLVSQNYPELEIVLVDDGSEDKSLEICRKFSAADERIRIICQAHRGVSAARNRGLAAATGAYLLFVDSDDMIHPGLAETFASQMEKCGADLAFCDWRELESPEMNRAWEQLAKQAPAGKWELAEGEAVGEWFYVKFKYILSGIGGKMIRRSVIGSLAFDESLSSGEDTLFLYSLLCQGIRMAHLPGKWYLYRRHDASITRSLKGAKGSNYFGICRIRRDIAYAKGWTSFAMIWEQELSAVIGNLFLERKEAGDRDGGRRLKKEAACELKQPLFWKLDLVFKAWFLSSIFGGPLYGILRRPYLLAQKLFHKEAGKEAGERAKTGILTFHCADNYGAMLQAYGLKRYLCDNGINTEIVAYEPPFMTGRHWWFPYIPQRGWKGRLWRIYGQYKGWKSNLSMRGDFFRRRENMRNFRRQYLLDAGQKRVFFAKKLKQLPYSCYIAGSDQIWNPDITIGLRRAYFGAFENKRKEKVIAYAASLGGAALSPAYDREFAKLLRHVDVVSLREAEAVPYVKKLCGKPVEAVLDPVFLLEQESWAHIETLPGRSGYILLYLTERNDELVSYVKRLSAEKELQVVELAGDIGIADRSFETAYTAGPSEFLGLIHKADYVITNSFHVTAFSIIFQKRFIVFPHTNRGARLRDILRVCGLADRLCKEGQAIDIDASIDWEEAGRRLEGAKKASKDFLMKHLGAER